MQVRIFNTVDGSPVLGSNVAPVSNVSWSLDYNAPDSMELTLDKTRELARWNAREKIRPWKHCAALIDGGEVIAAGPVLRRKWTGGLTVTCGGGWDLFQKRLVLNYALAAAWRDGEVVLDEDNPAPQWLLTFAGMSLGGIGAALVREALKWGPLLVDTPGTPEVGINVRTYQGWDLATTAERLTDLTGVLNAPMIRFAPYLRADGNLRFRYESGAVGNYRRMAETMPGHGVVLTDVDEDGSSMATDMFALGGRNEDIVLASRSTSRALPDAGWPVMQVADKSHTSVSDLATLKGYTNQGVVDGSTVPESTKLRVRASEGIRPGDVIDLTASNTFHGTREVQLHVAQVTGGLGEWCDVTGFPEEV
ncbi:hypothetical protein [Mycetocola saprophilus]|uniref:hypothetical protein n=1 Tax=Mycetocola saprophilus TaxID=76636 RepID=UPI0005BB05BB|nr:hypothetical protein [Mycetocola saprophilus]